MRALLLQLLAVISINVRSIPQRRWISLSTVIAIALVVLVLLGFLAMANGFQRTIAGSGADDVAIVLRPGSTAEINSSVSFEQMRLIEEAPGVARGQDGRPLVSPELYIIVNGVKRSSNTKANLPLRGIGERGAELRKDIKLSSGRLKEFDGFDLGSTVNFGTTRWTVVGVFENGGGVFESEIWADLPVVQSMFRRENPFQTIRARL